MGILILLFISGITAAQDFPSYKWTGDLRIREQREKDGDNEVRWSTRLRARFGLAVQVNEQLRAEVRLATAKSNRSTNQTLGDSSDPGPKRRFVGLDLGYAEWTPEDFVKLRVGRFPQIHYRPGDSQVVLDDDLTLEGLGLSLNHEVISHTQIWMHLGSAFIRENYDNYYSEDLSDNNLNFGQGGITWDNEMVQLTAGFGFFNFTSVQGMNFSDLAAGGKANGNTESSAGVIKNPYLPRQYFIEGKLKSGSLSSSLFFEYVENRETSDPNRAYWTGLSLGQKKWDAQIGYLEVESDAVLALFTNSDFANGTSDARGWIGAARWKFQKNMSLRLTQFLARTHMSQTDSAYDRTHVDITASF